MRRQPYIFHDPELEKMAEIAYLLGSEMALTYMTATVANAMLTAITTTGLFMGTNSASPGGTGANELVAGTAYTAVSGGRPPVTWAASSGGIVLSSDVQTFALLVTQAGGIPYYSLWTANTAGTYLFGGPTTGLSGSIPSGSNVTFTNALTLTVNA